MSGFGHFYRSSIGKKVVVAITGILMALFVMGHVAGNLKTFGGVGSDGVHKLDHYAAFLRSFGSDVLGHGGFLWATRLGLLVVVVLHIATVTMLHVQNSRARPIGYAKHGHRKTPAAYSMWWGGIILAAFIVYHILHLTLGVVHSDFVEGQVYRNVYIAFRNPVVVAVYVVSMLALGLHLFHGFWSLFQTLGLDSPDRNRLLRVAARIFSVIIVLGFISVPVAVLLGMLPAPRV